MPSKKADPFHWDSLVRLTHWGVAAACVGNLWLNEAGEEWHEWLGYTAMTLIGLRLVWGLSFAKGHARLRALIPSRADFRQQAVALHERTPATPGHHGSGKLAVWALWLTILATAGSGWFQNTELGFELGADDWHLWCTWALQGLIALHLTALAFTSWRQRSNLVARMLPSVRGKRAQQAPASQDQHS
ncbi:MAG: cytochrome b/b6 domain-containing protein [Aeromonas popoffii]|jgi:cytochrome b|uniref:cytochrome b/b6 domain-containing protein n=1 Tax=Aeromonas TaxID=642 RepID=UPI000D3BE5DA|nr:MULTISPECIES: cytochrome b/b6 domain-containing protein [unclassified Aeromonas]MDF2413049.1 cytochrome b [Aeromonas sp. 1HA1]PTT50585.1 cytochrome B [Aeromonas sp. HMWF014]